MCLEQFFKEHPVVALAFSGGVDSAFLLSEAKKYAELVRPYYIKTAFQPEFELRDAERLCQELDIELSVIYSDVLQNSLITANDSMRCYYCKNAIMQAICTAAEKEGIDCVLDGTNASDAEDERPGMKALKEKKIISPLRLCGLTKSEIRRLSREAGLFTWDKPAYACLATRIPTGTEITEEKLIRTEKAESFLSSLGFSDFRVRYTDEGSAKLQIKEEQFDLLLESRQIILSELKQYYTDVYLDLEARA
ncbi:MAG: ATP-dependent sacrificial sulfur transferase LarE [Oscillospiraceae bacterium]|nr:ATP-dependent sacrificial sulfur transferase LarE [Oscillospiraceae bacterium]